jgi:hypothetical protein
VDRLLCARNRYGIPLLSRIPDGETKTSLADLCAWIIVPMVSMRCYQRRTGEYGDKCDGAGGDVGAAGGDVPN